ALADFVRGCAGRDERRLQARGPRLQRQHYLADVACDDGVDLVLVDRALKCTYRVRRGRVIVVADDFDLAAVDAALGVDLVGRQLRGLGDRSARDGLGFGDHTDLE